MAHLSHISHLNVDVHHNARADLLGRWTFFIIPVMSFPLTQIYPTILTLPSSYSSYTLILITSSKRNICNRQVFTCGCNQKRLAAVKHRGLIVDALAKQMEKT